MSFNYGMAFREVGVVLERFAAEARWKVVLAGTNCCFLTPPINVARSGFLRGVSWLTDCRYERSDKGNAGL